MNDGYQTEVNRKCEPKNSSSSGAVGTISQEEFLIVQDQLIELRNKNYELLEEVKRHRNHSNSLTTRGAEALVFATKFIGRRNEKDFEAEKYEQEILALRRKVSAQEDEFRLQQSTLLNELHKIVKKCESLESESNQKIDVRSFQPYPDDTASWNDDTLNQVLRLGKDLISRIDANNGLKSVLEALDSLNFDMIKSKPDFECELRRFALSLNGVQEQVNVECDARREFGRTLRTFLLRISSLLRQFIPKVAVNEVAVQYEVSIVHQSTQYDLSAANLPEDESVASEETSLHGVRTAFESTSGNGAETDSKSSDCPITKTEDEDWRVEKEQLMVDLSEMQILIKVLECELANSKNEISELKVTVNSLDSLNQSMLIDIEEKMKAKDEELKIALKKQSAVMKQLRRDLKEEKKHADQADRRLNMHLVSAANDIPIRGGLPSFASSDSRIKKKFDIETASSADSWAEFGFDRTSTIMALDSDESCCSSVSALENAELIRRYTSLQKKHGETVDNLNAIDDENCRLTKEIVEKNIVIAEWIKKRPTYSIRGANETNSPSMSFRRMFDMIRVDDSVADIRDMNRRLQRMLEEALSKNIHLQMDIESLSEVQNSKRLS